LRGPAAAGSAALEPAYSGLLPCGRRPDQAQRIGRQRDCGAPPQPVPLRLNRPTAVYCHADAGPIKRSGSGNGAIARHRRSRFRRA